MAESVDSLSLHHEREKFAWTKLHGFFAIFDVGFWVDHFDLMVANGCWPRSVSGRRGLDCKCLQNSFDEFVWQSVRGQLQQQLVLQSLPVFSTTTTTTVMYLFAVGIYSILQMSVFYSMFGDIDWALFCKACCNGPQKGVWKFYPVWVYVDSGEDITILVTVSSQKYSL